MRIALPIPTFARRPLFWWCVYIVWFVLLYGLSSFSSMPAGTPNFFMWSDKVAHAIYFTTGTMALYWSLLLPGGWFASRPLLATTTCILAAALVGAFDEWHQTFTPGRSGADVPDWIADVVGGFIGVLLGFIGFRLLTPRP